MKILAIFALVFILYSPDVLGYGRAKEGKCPPLTGDENCAFKLLNSEYDQCTGQDLECPGDEKCCDDGCGGYECKLAIGLPPLPVIEPHCISAEIRARDQCEAANITYCYANECNKCCRHNSVCNPSSEHISKDECEKKLCKDIHCPGQGEICKLDKYHRATCECPGECPPDVPDMLVCGSDGETYQNECEMNLSACVTGDRIHAVHKGLCQLPTQKSPLEICSLAKETGHGWTLELKYYFNKQKGICEGLLYHGKGGNENNFDRYKDCTDMCADTITDVCVLPKLVGPCRAAFRRWYFNSRVQRCQRFTYGGCAGNANNFKNKEECNNQCICSLPKATGVCLAYFPSWFFNSKTGKCEEFVYGGCEGNMNRFHNKEICQKTCGGGKDIEILKPHCQDKSKFNCRSIKKCLPVSLKCNGVDDCGDNSDEEGCDPCANKKCDFYSTCVTTKNNTALCDCPTVCTDDWTPVCGSDNMTYSNLCNMKVESCLKQKLITKVRDGECNARAKTKCELERSKQQQRLLVGVYIPQCEEDGSYSSTQCHSSTRFCWCVDGEGNKLVETEMRFDRPNCTKEARPNSKCEKERAAGENGPLVGAFTPQCEEDGSYSEVQCYGSTGYCWCVDGEGNELVGTKVHVRSNRPNCTKEGPPPTDPPFNICDVTLCEFGRCMVVDGNATCQCNNACPRIYAPVCGTDNKTYPNLCVFDSEACERKEHIEVQYDGKCEQPPPTDPPFNICDITLCEFGRCMVVDGNATCQCNNACPRIYAPVCGTDNKTYPNLCVLDSEACEREEHIEVQYQGKCESKNPCEGVECDFHGNCVALQNGSTICQCPEICTAHYEPICGSDNKTYSNLCEMIVTSCTKQELITRKYNGECGKRKEPSKPCPEGCTAEYDPVCGSDGTTYSNLCWMKTNSCVKQKLITKKYDGECIMPKEGAVAKDPCQDFACEFYATCVPLKNGSNVCECPQICTREFNPVCGSDGLTYSNACEMKVTSCEKQELITKQYDGKCGGTRTSRPKSKCEKKRAARENGPLLLGAFTPKCEEDGSYSEVQCRSTGYCWCVDGEGNEVAETKVKFNRPNCTKELPPTDPPFDPCSISLCDFGICVNVIGTATCVCNNACPLIEAPVCGSDNKTYSNLCVMDSEACERKEYINVKHKGPCGTKSKCQRKLDEAMANQMPGRLIPSCELDGSYSAKQCHESSAYCWCVTRQGERIPGTRLRFSQPNCSQAVQSDPCADVKCDFYATCVPLDNGDHICDCPRFCTRENKPVCASNGETYANECEMQVASCQKLEMLFVESFGECGSQPKTVPPLDPCAISLCDFGICVNVNGTATCVCNNACPFIEQPVCGSDNKTYSNLCVMDSEACERKEYISVIYDGPCEEALPNTIDLCTSTKCSFNSQCEVVNGSARCVCEKGCTKELDPKCGSDNITYDNPCELRRVSCEEMREINIVTDGECAIPTITQPTVATIKALPKCKNCPTFGKNNIVKSFCSWYNKFVIIGEILNASNSGKEISVKVETKFKPTAKKTKFTPENIIKIIVQKPPRCLCDNLEFKTNEKYVLMGRKSKSKKIFVIKWKTGFVEKVSKPLVDKLKKTSERAKTWGLCALKKSG